jgi:hypothetical protein
VLENTKLKNEMVVEVLVQWMITKKTEGKIMTDNEIS